MKEIIKEIKDHQGHYLVLLFILLFGALTFFYLGRNPQAQIVSVFLTAVFYVLWGVVHHYLEGDLNIRIVMEYLAMAILGFVVLWMIINKA